MSKEARTSLSKAATFQDQNAVHEIFSELRREDPVAWCPELDGGRGFWSVTKYDDIQFVSKNPKLFSSDRVHGGITFETAETRRIRKISRSEGVQDKFKDLNILEAGDSMIQMDPPIHTMHRRMVAPGFSPKRLLNLSPQIRKRCVDILTQISGKGECEFISSVAAELPIQMLAELFGVDQEDRTKLLGWSNVIIGGDDPDMRLDTDHVITALTELYQYALDLHQKRREEPGDDLISMLANTEVEGKLTLLDQNKVITPHPSFRLFSTANTVGLGDTTGLYHGTQQINQGQMDRWHIVSTLNYLDPELELRVVLAKVPSFDTKEGREEVANMVSTGNLTRQGFTSGDISTLMSPRTIISWAENTSIFNDRNKAFEVTFLNKCDETERSIIAEYYQRCFNEDLEDSASESLEEE